MLLLSTLLVVQSLDVTAVGKDPHWKVAGRTATVVDIKGKHALELSEGPGEGVVWLDGSDFTNGSIEVDILGRSQPVPFTYAIRWPTKPSISGPSTFGRPIQPVTVTRFNTSRSRNGHGSDCGGSIRASTKPPSCLSL
jgi:hypothetical protein